MFASWKESGSRPNPSQINKFILKHMIILLIICIIAVAWKTTFIIIQNINISYLYQTSNNTFYLNWRRTDGPEYWIHPHFNISILTIQMFLTNQSYNHWLPNHISIIDVTTSLIHQNVCNEGQMFYSCYVKIKLKIK